MIRVSLVLMLVLGACKADVAKLKLRVAAASDLDHALPELAAAWKSKTGQELTLTFGSSGLLAKQIAEGAPFDLFASASPKFVNDVVAANSCDKTTVTPYARGRLAVLTATGVAPPTKLEELADARFKRIAIANPDHAPYGVAAREALEHAGVWAGVEARVVRGESVRQAMQMVTSGNAEVAIVALSLVGGAAKDRVLPIDAAMHAPIAQTMVACGAHVSDAAAFIAFVASPDGQTILARYGFAPP